MSSRARSASGSLGAEAERLTARFLRKQGYRIIRRNYRTRLGELDIVARDGEEVVFVEVRSRTRGTWEMPERSVTAAKQRRNCRAAMAFCTRNSLQPRPMRLDVVAVILEPGAEPEFRHYKDAFPIPTSAQ